VGAAAWARNGDATGVVAFAVEFDWLPLPFVVTPEIGVGLVALVGEGAWDLIDGRIRTLFVGERRRATLFGRVAFRVDSPSGWALSVGVVLAAGAAEAGAPVALPSLRLGGHFK
jgi:hypothetical protein